MSAYTMALKWALPLICSYAVFALPHRYHNQRDGIQLVETYAERTYFYVGGQYINASVSGGPVSQYMVGQIYVERLVPPVVRHHEPLVFIHGLAQTATNWLNTPDDREGWASYFLRQGYIVYLTDQPQRGRSPWLPGNGPLNVVSSTAASALFTAPEKVQPLPYPQARLHTQWPGSGLPGDPIFDAFYASQVQYQDNATLTALLNNHAYVALLDRINKPVFLITHSQAGVFGWQLGDTRPELTAGIVAIEPGAGPFDGWQGPPYTPGYFPKFGPYRYGITDLPLEYEPPLSVDNGEVLTQQNFPPAGPDKAPCTLQAEPARQLTNLAKIPVLHFVGEASFQTVYTECMARYLEQAGVQVDFLLLQEAGLYGNGHFSFLEKNNLEVAEQVVLPWLEKIQDQRQRNSSAPSFG